MPAKKSSLGVALKLVLVLALIGGGAFYAYQQIQVTASVAPVTRGKAVNAVTGSVLVDADGRYRELKTELGGRVVRCDALEPDKQFKKGEPLLMFDTSDLDRTMADTRRAYENLKKRRAIALEKSPARQVAQKLLDDARRLKELGEASEESVRAAQRALDEVETLESLNSFDGKKDSEEFEAKMAALEIMLQKMTILAPFDGAVQSTTVWENALIAPGAVAAIIYSDARVVGAKISEESFGLIELGHPAKVTFLIYPGEQFEAKVSKISPTADESQRYTVFLDVKIDPARLKPGSTGEVRITVGERDNQPLIPRRALRDRETVFVVKDGRVQKRKVVVGFTALNHIEIREGLAPGEHVIVENVDGFRDGERVRVEVLK